MLFSVFYKLACLLATQPSLYKQVNDSRPPANSCAAGGKEAPSFCNVTSVLSCVVAGDVYCDVTLIGTVWTSTTAV